LGSRARRRRADARCRCTELYVRRPLVIHSSFVASNLCSSSSIFHLRDDLLTGLITVMLTFRLSQSTHGTTAVTFSQECQSGGAMPPSLHTQRRRLKPISPTSVHGISVRRPSQVCGRLVSSTKPSREKRVRKTKPCQSFRKEFNP
jgi:hypothetical protein